MSYENSLSANVYFLEITRFECAHFICSVYDTIISYMEGVCQEYIIKELCCIETDSVMVS